MINVWDSLDCDIGCTTLCEVHLELNIYPFDIYILGLKDENIGFNFLFHFCQVFQIDLNTMQQYLTHLEKIAIMTSKKVHCRVQMTYNKPMCLLCI